VGTLIDASVAIAAERGELDLAQILATRSGEEAALSAITVSELLHGLHRAQTAAQRHRRQAFLESLLATLPVIAFDLVVARIHARIWAQLASKGVNVGERDLMVASTAIALGHSIATRDKRSFPRIPGLSIDLW
jgi:tRNA(fMet)-specific endonuclease VapC